MSAEDNIQVCNLTRFAGAVLPHALRRQVRAAVAEAAGHLLAEEPSPRGLREVDRVDDLVDWRHFQRVIPATSGRFRPKRAQFRGGREERGARALVFREALLRARERAGGAARRTTTSRSCGSSSSIRCRQRNSVERWRRTLRRHPLCGCKRSRGTWVRGTSCNATLQERHQRPPPAVARLARAASASPATGSKASHDLEQKMLIEEAFWR